MGSLSRCSRTPAPPSCAVSPRPRVRGYIQRCTFYSAAQTAGSEGVLDDGYDTEVGWSVGAGDNG